MNKSSETVSFNKMTYTDKPSYHCGMAKKPLEKNNPNAHRNRLPIATVVMPYKNSS